MKGRALIIGNSDGIGLDVTRELLKRDWEIIGISKSGSPIDDPSYGHIVADVQENEYLFELRSVLEKNEPIELCIFCAGIGELLDPVNMENEVKIVEVNLLGMVRTASYMIPMMVKRGRGHFIGLSSVADEMLSSEAPAIMPRRQDSRTTWRGSPWR
jgi:short-subunit dehydrogenase